MIENCRFQTSSVDTRGAHTNMAYTRSPERRLGAAPPGIQRLRDLLGGAGSHIVKKLLGRHSVLPSSRRLNTAYSAPSTLNNITVLILILISTLNNLIHASTNIIARRLERFYSPTNANNQTTTCPSIVSPISVAAPTTPDTDSDETCTSCCAVYDDAEPLGSCDDHVLRSVHFSTQHHPTRPPGPRPKTKRMSRDVSRRTGRFGMSYHQTDYDRFEEEDFERKEKARLHNLQPELPSSAHRRVLH